MERTKTKTTPLKRTTPVVKLSQQVKAKVDEPADPDFGDYEPYKGNFDTMISTGSTLLDYAISGGDKRGGGVPGGIVVEAFGPEGSGKTVLLCEMAGAIARQGGQSQFHDPEARLNAQFARMFDFEIDPKLYHKPNLVTDIFKTAYKWKPDNISVVNGVITDSLAALSTKLEMDNEDGDKMGMRRAKEFSEGFRKIARIIKSNNLLMLNSNQVRIDENSGTYKSTGGKAIAFYSSLRLRFGNPVKIEPTKSINGKDVKRAIGVETVVEVFKNSCWKPYRSAPVCIIFDYGIDDIRANLQFLKNYQEFEKEVYHIGSLALDKSMERSIKIVEKEGDELIKMLRSETLDVCEYIERRFETQRKPKMRL